MNTVDEFIEEYKKLEESVRRVYRLGRDQSVIAELKRQRGFESMKSEIQSCADLRNFFQHNSRLGADYAALPTAEAIAFVKKLNTMVNARPRCRDICVKKRDILWRSPTDAVRPAMELMRKQGHSCIPILRDGRVCGVFDEHAMFSYVSECRGSIFGEADSLTFRDLDSYISVTERNMQSFAFASMNAYVDNVVDLFEKQLENGKRVRLVLLTNSGKWTDRLQGIITPWDIIAASND